MLSEQTYIDETGGQSEGKSPERSTEKTKVGSGNSH